MDEGERVGRKTEEKQGGRKEGKGEERKTEEKQGGR